MLPKSGIRPLPAGGLPYPRVNVWPGLKPPGSGKAGAPMKAKMPNQPWSDPLSHVIGYAALI